MHDPEFVLFELRRPWPQRTSHGYGGPVPGRRWYWSPPFAVVAGRSLYFPGLITVWHHEPGGGDIFTVCKDLRGRTGLRDAWRHRRHLSLQVHPWQSFRRWAFTRCAWCGGPSRFRQGLGINLSAPGGLAEEGRADLPFWHGEQGLLHGGCSSVADAYRHCVCPEPDLRSKDPGYGWSWCSLCGKARFHDQDLELTWIYSTIRGLCRRGERPSPDVTAQIRRMWQLRRAAKEQA